PGAPSSFVGLLRPGGGEAHHTASPSRSKARNADFEGLEAEIRPISDPAPRRGNGVPRGVGHQMPVIGRRRAGSARSRSAHRLVAKHRPSEPAPPAAGAGNK